MSLILKEESLASIPNPAVGEATLFIDVADDHLKKKLSDGSIEIMQSTLLAGITALSGDVVAVGPGAVAVTLADTVIVSKILQGFLVAWGAVSNTDSIQSAISKLAGSTVISPNEISSNATVPSGYTWIRQSRTIFSGTAKITIQAGGRLTFI